MKNNDSDLGCFLKGILPACCCFVMLFENNLCHYVRVFSAFLYVSIIIIRPLFYLIINKIIHATLQRTY